MSVDPSLKGHVMHYIKQRKKKKKLEVKSRLKSLLSFFSFFFRIPLFVSLSLSFFFLVFCFHVFFACMYKTLLPLMKQSPYLFLSCPSWLYSSVCSIAMFMYPSRQARTPL